MDDKWRSLSELKSLIDDQVVYRNKSNSTCTGHTRNLTLSNMDLKGVSDTIDKMDIDDKYAFYNTEVVDKPEYCWMGMIYMVG